MAMSVANAEEILKDDYKPVIREQLNNVFFVLETASQNDDDVEGTEAVLTTHVSRNKGVGARAEFGTLPTAGQQGYKKSRIPLKYNYGTIKVSGPVLRATKSDRGSFTRALESEVKGIVTDLKRDVNRQCWTPATGQIALTAGSANATTVTVDTTAQARRLEPGYRYDIVEAASDLIVRTVDLTSVNETTKALTYVTVSTGPGTAATGNRIVNHGVTPSANLEITGLETIVDSAGALFDIDPATYPRWSSFERAVSGLPTDAEFERANDAVDLARGNSGVSVVLTSYEVVRTHAATMKAQRRYTGTEALVSGFKTVKVDTPRGSFHLRAERDCETDQAYGVDTSALIHYFASDWEFMDEDGAMLTRSSGQDAYEATLFKYHELATDTRNALFKLTSLTTI
jgi:hypothetical protein